MAGETGTTPRAVKLELELQERPHEFDFFQALRRLECAYRDQPRIGTSQHAAADPVRLAQVPSLGFAPSNVASFKSGAPGRPARLAIYGLGLLGPNGPMPTHFTEYVRDRERNADDPTLARFLDVFHHRMLSLFYRAWAATEPTVWFDRPEDDRFAAYVGSLFGLALPALADRDALPDMAKLHFVGHLSCQTRHPDGLRAMLADYWGVPVKIREFVGQWLELPHGSRWRLGEKRETGTLGHNTTVGERIWECQRKLRLVFGPLDLKDYLRLLPGGESLDGVVAMTRGCMGDELIWDLQLVLRRDQVPPQVLGGKGRLGRTSWLAGRPFERDADDLVLDPLAREFSHG